MKNLALLLFLAFLVRPVRGQGRQFLPDFAPSPSETNSAERPYRDDTCLNGYWKFLPVSVAAAPDRQKLVNPDLPAGPVWAATPIRIPSPWNVNSFPGGRDGGDFITYPDYPAAWDTVKAGWLMRPIHYRAAWRGQRQILHFEAVAGFVRVFINGISVGSHFDNFLPFDLDITDRLRPGVDNELLVWVASARLFDEKTPYGRRTYVGGSFWGQHIAGIWQDVDLLIRPAVYISQTAVRSLVSRDSLTLAVTLHNASSHAFPLRLSANVCPWINKAGAGIIAAPEPKGQLGSGVLTFRGPSIVLAAHTDTTIFFSTAVHGRLALWEPEHPRLYALLVRLTPGGSRTPRDVAYTRFGWRETTIRDKQFLLNGRPLVLKGDSWHFMGIPQMTRRYAWAWYTMLKAAHANAVRLHAEPYPSFYLDMADEMGILVLDETGMWASDGGPNIGSEQYWTASDAHLRDLIRRDRNHPSVFGWSVCNENIPVAINVFHAPEQLVQRQLSAIDHWVAIAREMDPTREWISGDGETGRPTDLPTLIGHYGGEPDYKKWSSGQRLWGIGESGMAYYGTPRQTAAFNGNASYVSQWGRMEGVAAEATKLVRLQAQYKAVYRSVFNLVWYGLQPLALGLTDTTRSPAPDDGIFFHPFKEGQPGVQPERLGPYTTTLNPGYDPGLPLYRTWPLFTALAAAFADSGAGSDSGMQVQAQAEPPKTASPPSGFTGSATVRLLAGENSGLDTLLRSLGAVISDSSDHLIIDGIHLPDATVLSSATALSSAKAKYILVWGIRPANITAIDAILPAPVTLTDRKATSFIPVRENGLLQGLDTADWYFSEITRRPVSEYGLTGEFVRQGQVLLTDCNTDWQRWNGRPEHSKTAAVLRSERETKPAGNIFVEYPTSPGSISLLSIDPDILYRIAKPVMRRLLSNWGLDLADSARHGIDSLSPSVRAALDGTGTLRQAMLSTTRNGADHWQWTNTFGLSGSYRLGFWLYSPRSLVNLLAEPDLPILNMTVRGSREWRLLINDSSVAESTHPALLPLGKGWNHLVLEIRGATGQSLLVQLTSGTPGFLSTLRSAVIAPETESTPNDDAHE